MFAFLGRVVPRIAERTDQTLEGRCIPLCRACLAVVASVDVRFLSRTRTLASLLVKCEILRTSHTLLVG